MATNAIAMRIRQFILNTGGLGGLAKTATPVNQQSGGGSNPLNTKRLRQAVVIKNVRSDWLKNRRLL